MPLYTSHRLVCVVQNEMHSLCRQALRRPACRALQRAQFSVNARLPLSSIIKTDLFEEHAPEKIKEIWETHYTGLIAWCPPMLQWADSVRTQKRRMLSGPPSPPLNTKTSLPGQPSSESVCSHAARHIYSDARQLLTPSSRNVQSVLPVSGAARRRFLQPSVPGAAIPVSRLRVTARTMAADCR